MCGGNHDCKCNQTLLQKVISQDFNPSRSCCVLDEANISQLKSTNNELKTLINRLDCLTCAVEDSLRFNRSHINVEQSTAACTCIECIPLLPPTKRACCSDCARSTRSTCTCVEIEADNICNVCHVYKTTNNRQNDYSFSWTVCDECERILRLSREKKFREEKKCDNTIYPAVRYPSGRQHFCSSCEKCVSELRERRRSRSRSRGRTRSPAPSRVSVDDLPRPQWNGGPYKQYYGWKDWKLNHNKK